jgi:murein DD-endopeptidase MepM/ murein hydrolase activator NlpD
VRQVHKVLRATEMRIAKNGLKAGVVAGVFLCAWAASAAERPSCTGGLELRLTAPQASQGSLVLAEIRSRQPLREMTGKWNDRNVYFWKESAAPAASRSASSAYRRQALLGVDLEKAAGTYELAVNATTETGAQAACIAKVIVVAGKFATERLTVEKQFVEPNQQQADRAKAEQQKLRELFDTITPERLWQGPFRMPLEGGVRGSNFGKRRVLNGQSRPPHTGADFPALTGTPVHATQSGRVVLAEELYFSGNTVIVDHGLGVYSLYGHLSAIDVAAGDNVKAGGLLGKVGATGRVTGPHLHWGMTVNRARVDPVRMVSLFQVNRRRK